MKIGRLALLSSLSITKETPQRQDRLIKRYEYNHGAVDRIEREGALIVVELLQRPDKMLYGRVRVYPGAESIPPMMHTFGKINIPPTNETIPVSDTTMVSLCGNSTTLTVTVQPSIFGWALPYTFASLMFIVSGTVGPGRAPKKVDEIIYGFRAYCEL